MAQPHEARSVSAGTVVGILLVSIWMAVSLLFTFLLGAGDIYVCGSGDDACLDRYAALWAALLVVVGISILGTILLWAFPRTRPWGLALGVLGTGGAAAAFTILYDVPL